MTAIIADYVVMIMKLKQTSYLITVYVMIMKLKCMIIWMVI